MSKQAVITELDSAITEGNSTPSTLYVPVYNSLSMLLELRTAVTASNSPRDFAMFMNQYKNGFQNCDRLNVGLLAAKSLDGDPDHQSYSNSLHNVWGTMQKIIKVGTP